MLYFETLSTYLGEGQVCTTCSFLWEWNGWVDFPPSSRVLNVTRLSQILCLIQTLVFRFGQGLFSLHQFTGEAGREVFTHKFFLFHRVKYYSYVTNTYTHTQKIILIMHSLPNCLLTMQEFMQPKSNRGIWSVL